MGIMNRFLLLVYALFISVSVLGAAGVVLQLIPEGIFLNELHYVSARPETMAVLVVVFLLGIHLIGAALFSGTSSDKKKDVRSGEIALVTGEQGEVNIAVPAVKSLSERIALSVHGVRGAQAKLVTGRKEGTPLTISMQLILLQGNSAPSIGTQVTRAVQQELAATLNLSNVPVEISITEISNAPLEKKRVV